MRKNKAEYKKLQDENQHLKKTKILITSNKKPSSSTITNTNQHETTLQTELSRLYQEIAKLREDYKILEDKYQVSAEIFE